MKREGVPICRRQQLSGHLIDLVITIPTDYAYFLYYSFLFVLSMQPKPKCEREHDIMDSNAGSPCEEPQKFGMSVFVMQMKATSCYPD